MIKPRRKFALLLGLGVALGACALALIFKPASPPILRPLTNSSSGSQWRFVLYARDSVVAVERDTRKAVVTRAGKIETNWYDAGHTTLIALNPGNEWVFSIDVPTDATQMVVSVPCKIAPAGMKRFLNSQEAMTDSLQRALHRVSWHDAEIFSSVFIKTGETWQELPK